VQPALSERSESNGTPISLTPPCCTNRS